MAGKIRFSGERKSELLKASSGERCGPYNFVPTSLACNVQNVKVFASPCTKSNRL